MRRIITSVLLLCFVVAANAKRQSGVPHVPGISVLSQRQNVQLQRMLERHRLMMGNLNAAALKTTAGTERLIAESDYDFTLAPGSQQIDSLRLSYSGARKSAYDFDNMTYDYDNNIDYPSAFGMGGYIRFDTVRTYDPPGSASFTATGARKYNSAGNVAVNANTNYITYFLYDAQNRVIRTTELAYDMSTMTWDSSARDFYFYNSSGFVIKDSSEQYNLGLWEPYLTGDFTLNSSGYPTKISYGFSLTPGIRVAFAEISILYGSNLTLPLRTTLKFLNSTGLFLENQSKDSMSYTGNIPVFRNSYQWDTLASVWVLSAEERRHLNAASLPDSIWLRNLQTGNSDTSISKLGYTSQGNPLYARYYSGKQTAPYSEARYYYETFNLGLPGTHLPKILAVYPIPSNNVLHFSEQISGDYHIVNATGQVLASGYLQAAGSIPVDLLSPGYYQLYVQDLKGDTYLAKFIRQ